MFDVVNVSVKVTAPAVEIVKNSMRSGHSFASRKIDPFQPTEMSRWMLPCGSHWSRSIDVSPDSGTGALPGSSRVRKLDSPTPSPISTRLAEIRAKPFPSATAEIVHS